MQIKHFTVEDKLHLCEKTSTWILKNTGQFEKECPSYTYPVSSAPCNSRCKECIIPSLGQELEAQLGFRRKKGTLMIVPTKAHHEFLEMSRSQHSYPKPPVPLYGCLEPPRTLGTWVGKACRVWDVPRVSMAQLVFWVRECSEKVRSQGGIQKKKKKCLPLNNTAKQTSSSERNELSIQLKERGGTKTSHKEADGPMSNRAPYTSKRTWIHITSVGGRQEVGRWMGLSGQLSSPKIHTPDSRGHLKRTRQKMIEQDTGSLSTGI